MNLRKEIRNEKKEYLDFSIKTFKSLNENGEDWKLITKPTLPIFSLFLSSDVGRKRNEMKCSRYFL